jgi:nitroreductase/dihydropteridine reductase
MSLINDLNWRYATKKMNGENVSAEKLDLILDAANLAATSYGLQPFTILVVSNKEVKTKLQEAAYNQPQVGGSSHVLVFAVPIKITEAHIDAHISNITKIRNLPSEALAGLKQTILSTVGALPQEQQQIWAAKQAYIAFGTVLLAAAEQKVDACPMEGFVSSKFDEILGLEEKGLKSVVVAAIGYRSAEDATANFKKVRKAKDVLFEFVN